MNALKGSWLKATVVWASRLVMIASLFFVGRLLISQWSAVSALLSANILPGVALAACTLLISTLIGAEIWFHVMGGSSTCSRRTAFGVLLTTQIAKYIPGNFGVFFGRPYLAKKFNIPKAPVFGSVFLEILFVAGFTCIFCLFLAPEAFETLRQEGILRFSFPLQAAIPLALCILFVLPLVPKPLNWALSKSNIKGLAFPNISFKRYPLIAAMYLSQFTLIGFANWLLLKALFPHTTITFALCAVANAIAIFVGFVSPGAPAGLGVREAVLLVMFRSHIGEPGAVALVALSRFLNIGIDIVSSATAWATLPRQPHTAETATPTNSVE